MKRIILLIIICTCIVSEQFGSTHTAELLKQLHNSTSNYIFVVSHRADWRNAPENSLQAIENCIMMGVDMVEIDVRMTKDSILMLMHDETIDRTTSGKGKISDYTYSELQNVVLKDGLGVKTFHKIPTLEEVMTLAKGKILVNIDKAGDYMDKVMTVLRKTETVKEVVLKGSKTYENVRVQYGKLLDEMIYMPILNEKNKNPEDFIESFMTHYKPVAYEIVFSSTESRVYQLIPTFQKQPARVWINALWPEMNAGHCDELAVKNPEENWGWIIKNGGNIIQTDRPEALLKYLRSKKLHP